MEQYHGERVHPGSTTPSGHLTGLNSPDALAFDSSGNLYVANSGQQYGEQVRTGDHHAYAPRSPG